MNLFEHATRQQLRFESNKGLLTVEDLWQLPLQSKSGFDLDTVAKGVNAALKSTTEESFVATRTNPAKANHEIRLEIVKHIISVKMEENAAKLDAASKAEKKAKLLDVLSRKQDAELENLTPEQLAAKIAELS